VAAVDLRVRGLGSLDGGGQSGEIVDQPVPAVTFRPSKRCSTPACGSTGPSSTRCAKVENENRRVSRMMPPPRAVIMPWVSSSAQGPRGGSRPTRIINGCGQTTDHRRPHSGRRVGFVRHRRRPEPPPARHLRDVPALRGADPVRTPGGLADDQALHALPVRHRNLPARMSRHRWPRHSSRLSRRPAGRLGIGPRHVGLWPQPQQVRPAWPP
jgi:hypothetical protein